MKYKEVYPELNTGVREKKFCTAIIVIHTYKFLIKISKFFVN